MGFIAETIATAENKAEAIKMCACISVSMMSCARVLMVNNLSIK